MTTRLVFCALICMVIAACQPTPIIVTERVKSPASYATSTTQATFTLTPSNTLTSTPSRTATHTRTTIPTKTSTPTITPVPQAAILYEEDFEDSQVAQWDNRSSTAMQLLEENGNHFWHFTASGPVSYPGIWKTDGTGEWTDYAFENRVRMINGGVFISFRAYGKSASFYNVFLDVSNDWVVFADYDNEREESYVTFGGKNFKFDENKWYKVRIEAVGDFMKCFIDDKLVTSDSRSSVYYGGIGYYTGQEGEIDIDDIRVWEISPE